MVIYAWYKDQRDSEPRAAFMAGDAMLIIMSTVWVFSLLLGDVPAVCIAFIAPKWVPDQKLQLFGETRSHSSPCS